MAFKMKTAGLSDRSTSAALDRRSGPDPKTFRQIKGRGTIEAFDHVKYSDDLSEDPYAMSTDAWSDVVIDVHVSQCRKWIFNPRHAIVEDRIPELAKLISDLGQLDPIIVAKADDESGMFDILCGQRRWLAIKSTDFNGGIIKARVVPEDSSFAMKMQLAVESQSNTDPLRDIDYALTVLELIRQGKNAGLVLRKDKATISKLKSIARLPDEILNEVKDHPDKLAMNICYEIVQICPLKADPETDRGSTGLQKPPEKQALWTAEQGKTIDSVLSLVKSIVADDMTVADVARAARAMSGNLAKKTRRSWAIYDVDDSMKSSGTVKARESTGEVIVSWKGVKPAGLEQIRIFALQLSKDKNMVDREKLSETKQKR